MSAQAQCDRSPSVSWPVLLQSRGIVGWFYTNNPFYVLSASLVLAGLRMSFHPHGKIWDTWTLTLGLAAYTLLLAVTAWLLIRHGRVWQDVRTILLLVVLMLLATSVTFDDTLIWRPAVGRLFFLGGLGFAVIVSEALLRGIRLRLPLGFRVPYYLILALFFGYPAALSFLMDQPRSAAMHWGLFGFSPAAGAVFLALIPAIRRGPKYVAGNGSPWPWPLYPWVLFGFLALGVVWRAYSLCISLHNVEQFHTIFGPYFLIPFLLALAVLLLEMGLVAANRAVTRLALAIPFALVPLAVLGHRPEPAYAHFLALFSDSLGGTPLFYTWLGILAFGGYAILRRAQEGWGAALAALIALAVVGPGTSDVRSLESPQMLPLLVVGAVQLCRGLLGQKTSRVLAGTSALAVAGAIALGPWCPPGAQAALVFHCELLALLATGALCHDELAWFLQQLGALALAGAGIAAAVGDPWLEAHFSPALRSAYPLLLAAAAAGYAELLGLRCYLLASGLCLGGWVLQAGERGYTLLRQLLAGLDHIAAGLAFFALAVVISLCKAGRLRRVKNEG